MFRLGSTTSHTRHRPRGVLGTLLAASLVAGGAVVAATVPAVATPPVPAPASRAGLVSLSDVGGGLRSAEVAVPLSARRGGKPAGPTRLRTDGFSMLALTWAGPGVLDADVRVRHDGQWQAWRELETLTDGPDADAAEASTRRGTDLVWTGAAEEVEIRPQGRVPAGLSVVLIDPTAVQGRAEPALGRGSRPARPTRAPRPKVRSRASWGAVERWRAGAPVYDRVIRQVHVHHTASSNRYSRGDVPGILAGIYRYHTKSLGWSDIGYNVLVDRFGRAWVGRRGGVGKRVRGAHTLGFNHKSTGIAVIGRFERRTPPQRVLTKIAKIAAWQFDRHHTRARGKVARTSRGSDLYPARTKVRLPRIDAHSHTNSTACPGDQLRAALPEIRRLAQRRIRRFG